MIVQNIMIWDKDGPYVVFKMPAETRFSWNNIEKHHIDRITIDCDDPDSNFQWTDAGAKYTP